MGDVNIANTHTGPAEAAIEAAAVLLRKRGERSTPPRVAVVRVLAGRNDHLTAEQVVAEVGHAAPAVHRASVYRALDTLAGLGIVAHVALSGTCEACTQLRAGAR